MFSPAFHPKTHDDVYSFPKSNTTIKCIFLASLKFLDYLPSHGLKFHLKNIFMLTIWLSMACLLSPKESPQVWKEGAHLFCNLFSSLGRKGMTPRREQKAGD